MGCVVLSLGCILLDYPNVYIVAIGKFVLIIAYGVLIVVDCSVLHIHVYVVYVKTCNCTKLVT